MGRVLIAGATGAVGRPLCRLLVAEGWEVTGTTRSAAKAPSLRAVGVEPIVIDVFDALALHRAVADARPEIIVHQLTDLPPGLDPARMAEARARTARLREEGTRNLIVAAVAAGARRMVAQSIAFAYAAGPQPYSEDSPLDPAQRGVISLESQVLESPLEGVILRYGRFYGPGTGFDARRTEGAPLHVDAAADAARRALVQGRGIYNVAEDDGVLSIRKVVDELAWSPDFRLAKAADASAN